MPAATNLITMKNNKSTFKILFLGVLLLLVDRSVAQNVLVRCDVTNNYVCARYNSSTTFILEPGLMDGCYINTYQITGIPTSAYNAVLMDDTGGGGGVLPTLAQSAPDDDLIQPMTIEPPGQHRRLKVYWLTGASNYSPIVSIYPTAGLEDFECKNTSAHKFNVDFTNCGGVDPGCPIPDFGSNSFSATSDELQMLESQTNGIVYCEDGCPYDPSAPCNASISDGPISEMSIAQPAVLLDCDNVYCPGTYYIDMKTLGCIAEVEVVEDIIYTAANSSQSQGSCNASTTTVICDGGDVSLLGPSNYDEYIWNDRGTRYSSSTRQYVAQNVTIGTTVTVTAYKYECDGISKYTICHQINVRNTVTPYVSINSVQNPPNICLEEGNSVELKASTNVSNAKYSWKHNENPNEISTNATINPSPSGIRTYTVKMTTTRECVTKNTDTESVTIKPMITPSVEITVDPEDVSICADESISLSANHPNVTNVTYKWSYVGTTDIIGTSKTINRSPDVSRAYSVEITTSEECRTKDTDSDTQNIDVTSNITPVVVLDNTSPASICLGDPVTLIAEGNTNDQTFEWSRASAAVNPVHVGSSITVNDLTLDDTFSVVLHTTDECVTSSSSVPLEHEVTVIDEPEPDVSISFIDVYGPDDDIVCTGELVELTAVPTAGTNVNTFSWTKNGLPIGQGETITTPVNELSNISVSMTTNQACHPGPYNGNISIDIYELKPEVVAESIRETSFEVIWEEMPGTTSYDLSIVGQDDGITYEATTNDTQYTFTGLIGNHYYDVTVTAADGDCEAEETITALTVPPVVAFASIYASPEGQNTFNVTWNLTNDHPNRILNSEIDVFEKDGSEPFIAKAPGGTSENITCPNSNYQYTVYIRQVNASGPSDNSQPYYIRWGGRLNTVETKGFDENGEVISHTKDFFDLTGQLIQSQTKKMEEQTVLATIPLYDHYQRKVGSTLPAPVGLEEIGYRAGILRNADNEEYDYEDLNASNPVGTQSHTVGAYYSAANTLEPNTPQTAYPYTRTDFYEDGSGEVRRSAAPGDALHMGAGHESLTKTLPIGDQSQELKHYNALRKLVLNLDEMPTLVRVYKQVSIDPDDKEVVSYQTEAGAIATAIVKDDSQEITYSANEEGHVEIHVPDRGAFKTSITLTHKSGETFRVLDKIQDESDKGLSGTPASIELEGGIYSVEGVSQVTYQPGYAEYSYNIYDNAGRLAASIAPLGVEQVLLGGVPSTREELTYTTFYSYDFQGRLIEMDEPDAGKTYYAYRKDGSIRFSQNAEQAANNTSGGDISFSYTNYDPSGRPTESGEYTYNTTTANWTLSELNSYLEERALKDGDEYTNAWMSSLSPGGTTSDWVKTYYDLTYKNDAGKSLSDELATYMDTWYSTKYSPGHGYDTHGFALMYEQDFLEGAVSYTENEQVRTWYSYDEFGQVTFIVMYYENMGSSGQYFTIDYQYDYFGNVIEVAYQKYFTGEAFYHHYEYNKNQQLTKVYTSQSGVDDPYKYLHATYYYYLHGPLKRIELAEDLQGLDYTYTAQGWLKAINSPANNLDPGQDGNNGFFHDAFGMEIDYYAEDHASNLFSSVNAVTESKEQFGGNIRAITWGREGTAEDERFFYEKETFDTALEEDVSIATRQEIILAEGFDTNGYAFEAGIDPEALMDVPLEIEAQQYEYTYDFKNQLKEAFYTDAVASAGSLEKFKVSGVIELEGGSTADGIFYDANGNIKNLKRNNEEGTLMDDFAYSYIENKNQLEEVDDAVDGIYASYEYNAIGQMTAALGRGTFGDQYFDYDVTGKVVAIYSVAAKTAEQLVAEYEYDDRGFRIRKVEHSDQGDEETWYVRDASGNIIAIYEKEGADLELSELPIYGSGKIGTSFRDPLKHKYSYELTDHLGNVRSVISKLKFYEVATIETENQPHEASIWENVTNESLRDMDMMFNTTNIKGDEKYSVRLDGSNGAVGPALSRAVQKGDKVSFHAKAMYIEDYASSGLADDMFGLIAGAYGVTAGGETQAIYDGLNSAVASAAGFLATPPAGVPKAYIQCLVFDKDFNDITPGDAHVMVSSAAGGNASSAETIAKEIEITEDGYIYLYVANETKDAQVHFDDITISVLGFDISEMTDYYPGGSVATHWEKEPYRFGYQGQFAEEDEETGYNHFQLRDYDPVIWRTNTIDPFRQFASPYSWVGNNPVIGIDPTGGECPTCPKTSDYEYYHNSPTSYGYDASLGGNGTFQRMQELIISAPRPLVTSNVPQWLTTKFNTGGIEIGAQLQFTMGPQSLNDFGLFGATYNAGSATLLNINPKLKWVYGDDYLGFGGSSFGFDMAGLNGETTVTVGASSETWIDMKSSTSFILNSKGERIAKRTSAGVGTVFLEAKFTHDHVHGRSEIKIGGQEDASASFFGFGIKGALNAQATLNQR